MSTPALSVHLFLVLVIILIACRLAGAMLRWLGQPAVVGEMIAGVCLGPSVFGLFFPEAHAWLFPRHPADAPGGTHPVMAAIYCIAQLGLALYMFCVGLDFDLPVLRTRARTAAAISIAGTAAPFVVGALIIIALPNNSGLFLLGVPFAQQILFLGAAMAITAFPMLARIVQERGLTHAPVGAIALAAGAAGDAVAWAVLAIVLTTCTQDWSIAARAIGGGIAYTAIVLTLGRRALATMLTLGRGTYQADSSHVVTTLIIVLTCAALTDFLGIHAVFGAFVLGLAVPRGLMATTLRDRIEPLTTSLLVPMFFVYSGLNTQLSLVGTGGLWGVLFLVLAAPVVSKGLACYFAARFCGESKHESMAIGALMNARGMMELLLATIGLERGIITPAMFAILVVMTIVTTFLATPIVRLSLGQRSAPAELRPRATAGSPATHPG